MTEVNLTPPRQRADGAGTALLAAGVLVLAAVLWALRDLAVLIGLAVLLAYALDPFVEALESLKVRGRGLPRPIAAAIVMLVMVALACVSLAWILPQAGGELLKFVERAPQIVDDLTGRLHQWAVTGGFVNFTDPAIESLRANLGSLSRNAAGPIGNALGRVFGSLGTLVGFALLPLLAFYLLAEREDVRHSVFRFIPPLYHARVRTAATAMDRALRSYVRGQAVVCLVMGTAVGIALALLRFPYALFLGVLVGLAEVVPYLGYLSASTAIVLTGFTLGPVPALLGFLAYTAINNLVGMLITPRVMSRYLEMHPFVITISVFAGGKLLGPPGVLLALPMAGVVQAMISEFAPRSQDEIIIPK